MALTWPSRTTLPIADGSKGLTVRVIDYVLDDPGRPNSDHYRLLTNLLARPIRLRLGNWPLSTLSASRPPWMSSRSTSVGRVSFCDPRSQKASIKRPTVTCSLTTPSASSCMMPPWKPAWIPTAPLSCAACGWYDASPRSRLFPPDEIAAVRSRAIAEIRSVRLPERRLCSSPQMVKRKMTGYNAKRTEHRHWPQPTRQTNPSSSLSKRYGD